jgi:hypothetical protein
MVNVRKNAMREYHYLVYEKKRMEQAPKKYPAIYKYMSREELETEKREYENICSKIELLKKILKTE